MVRRPGGDTGGEAGEPVVAGERAGHVQTQGAILPESATSLQSAHRPGRTVLRLDSPVRRNAGPSVLPELAVAAFTGGEPLGAGDAFSEERVEAPGTLGAQSVGEREVPLGDG